MSNVLPFLRRGVQRFRAWPLVLRILCAGAGASVAGIIAIAIVTSSAKCRLERLAAENVAGFRAHLDECLGHVARPDPGAPASLLESGGESASFTALTRALGVDSLLLVPGFVALLVSATLAFWPTSRSRTVRWWDIAEQCLVALIVAGGLFDWIENGLTLHALFRHRAGTLHDGIIADSLAATQFKWTLLGFATLAIGIVASFLSPVRRRISGLVGSVAGLGVALAALVGPGHAQASVLALAVAWIGFVISGARHGVAA